MDWQRQMLGIFASVQKIPSYLLYTSNFIHCRYLARAVLVPFAYKAPPVTANSLEDILTNAPAAIPDAIRIGQDVVAVDSSTLNDMAEQIKDVVGDANIDSRLAMQYAFSVLCAQEVCRLPVVLIARNSYVADCFNGRG